MCLAVPYRIISKDGNKAIADVFGMKKGDRHPHYRRC